MKISNKNILPLCLLLTPLIGLGMDLYTPSLPAITHYFHVSHYAVKLTVILYLAAFGLSQPLVGIISDHVERKNFILIALGFYVISAFLCAFSASIHWLYFFRIINAICATSIAVVIKSIILDNFTGKMLAKANNYFTLSWSVTPMIAPVIGGYLQHYYNWQASFYFMSIYALFGFVFSCFLFQNTKQITEKKVLSVSSVLQKWKILFSDKIYVAAIFILSVENTILFLYYTAAPFIIQQTLHFTAAQYGNVMLFAGASYVIGNVINDRLLNYFSVEKLIAIGLGVSVIAPIIPMLILWFSKNQVINIYLVTLPIFILFMCDGLIFANVATKSLSSYTKFSGIAGGLLAGTFNISVSVIVAICAHWLNLYNIVTLNLTYLLMLILSCCVFVFFFKKNCDINTVL